MKSNLLKAFLTALGLLMAFSGCQFFDKANTIYESEVEDMVELQGLLPALQAAQSMTMPGADQVTPTVGGFRVMTFNPDDTATVVDDTPDSLYTDLLGSGTADAEGYYRYPADGTLPDDIYGTPGNKGYLEIAVDSGTPDYRVRFYIYPTLSPVVEFVYEEYYVNGGSWNLVDAAGAEDPIAYIANETHYFDGIVQTNTVEWSSSIDSLYYDTFEVPDNPSDAKYDYKASYLAEGELEKGSPAGAQFSVQVKSAFSDDDAGDLEAVEFYTEVSGILSALSYVTREFDKAQLSFTEKTVRRYQEDQVTGDKVVRARSETSVTAGDYSWDIVTSEGVNIGTDDAGKVTYSSQVLHNVDGVTLRGTTVDLVETAAGSGDFGGTMVIDNEEETTSYTVELTSANGLVLTADGKPVGTFGSHERRKGQPVWVKLKKGEFSGEIIGELLEGVYDSGLPEDADVTVGKGFGVISRGNSSSAR